MHFFLLKSTQVLKNCNYPEFSPFHENKYSVTGSHKKSGFVSDKSRRKFFFGLKIKIIKSVSTRFQEFDLTIPNLEKSNYGVVKITFYNIFLDKIE
jgi:hypothetical protein